MHVGRCTARFAKEEERQGKSKRTTREFIQRRAFTESRPQMMSGNSAEKKKKRERDRSSGSVRNIYE
jgi:hypothetical protein